MEDPVRLTTRREFARQAAVAAAVPLLASIPGCAHPAPAPVPEAAHEPAPPAPAAPPAPPISAAPAGQRPPDAVAAALTQALREKYGARLTDEQWAEVRQGVEGNLASAKALHDYVIPMATEPPFGFRPYRGGEG